MNNIEYLKEISRMTSDLGVAITFMIVFLFVFLIFSIVLSIQLPKLIKNYLVEKNKRRQTELERDKERWDKHVDLTEQGWRVIGQNDELLFHVRSEAQDATNSIKDLNADFNVKMRCLDEISEDSEVIKTMLTDIYKSLEVVKENSERNKQTDEAVARIEQSISSLLIYLQEREEY